MLRDRIATLRRRVQELEDGEITPRQLKDEMLWLCVDCQRIMTDLPRLDREEIARRVREQARLLERKRAALARRAG
jgi:heterodisulfide reductase subunit C